MNYSVKKKNLALVMVTIASAFNARKNFTFLSLVKHNACVRIIDYGRLNMNRHEIT